MATIDNDQTLPLLALAARCRHVERSRRNLARQALAYRAQLRAYQQLSNSGRAEYEVHRKASGLRRRFRDFEQRLRQLEEGERNLSRDRELWDRELRERLSRLQMAERQLEERRRQLENAGRLGALSV